MNEYKKLCNRGHEAMSGVPTDYRAAADMYREATLIAPSKWTLLRWDCFHTFAYILSRPEISGVHEAKAR